MLYSRVLLFHVLLSPSLCYSFQLNKLQNPRQHRSGGGACLHGHPHGGFCGRHPVPLPLRQHHHPLHLPLHLARLQTLRSGGRQLNHFLRKIISFAKLLSCDLIDDLLRILNLRSTINLINEPQGYGTLRACQSSRGQEDYILQLQLQGEI